MGRTGVTNPLRSGDRSGANDGDETGASISQTVICRPGFRSPMDPVKLIGDVISILTLLAVVGILVWFVISRVLPFFG